MGVVNPKTGKTIILQGLIDTGAFTTILDPEAAKQLQSIYPNLLASREAKNIPSERTLKLSGAFNASATAAVVVDAMFTLFPEEDVFHQRAYVSPVPGNFDVLIGMDFLSDHDMTIKAKTGTVTWTSNGQTRSVITSPYKVANFITALRKTDTLSTGGPPKVPLKGYTDKNTETKRPNQGLSKALSHYEKQKLLERQEPKLILSEQYSPTLKEAVACYQQEINSRPVIAMTTPDTDTSCPCIAHTKRASIYPCISCARTPPDKNINQKLQPTRLN